MRAVIQRVSSAEIFIGHSDSNGAIGPGLLVLLGVMQGDGKEQAEFLAKKIAGLRIFSDDAGKQNLSVQDIGGERLVVSNFTLGAECSPGRRPVYAQSARPEEAEALYEHFLACLRREQPKPVVTGVFGAHMEIRMTADGPVTIWLDTEALGK